VALIPGLVSELTMFWLHRARTYENYQVSVLRCRELLRRVDASAQFLEYNVKYAPIAALYRSQGAVQVALLANPDMGVWWLKRFVALFVLSRFFRRFSVVYPRGEWYGYFMRKMLVFVEYLLKRIREPNGPVV